MTGMEKREDMIEASSAVRETVYELMVANRILAHEGVLDAFGHVSVRHPERPDRYLLAKSRSPQFVTEQDIMEFDLDSNPVNPTDQRLYSERPIHGCIYKARPDVMAVCHNHAHSLLPFGVTGNPLRPVFHVAAAMGPDVPTWDIRDEFGDNTDMLVVDNARGRSLAKALGSGRVCLMRGHGGVVAAPNLKSAVYIGITVMQNAAIAIEAQRMGEVKYLSAGEIREQSERILLGDLGLDRAWEY